MFANLYNTQWGTNFTEWIEGSFSSKFYIWSYNNYDAEKSFITPSEETRVPLKGVFYEGVKGELPLIHEGISFSRKGILVTAYGENPYGEGTTLRLWEQSGNGGICKVTLSEGNIFKKACPCNLRGEIIDANGIEIKDNSFECEVGANQPVSFILK